MNLPGRPHGNWRWRFAAPALTPEIRRRLRALTEGSGRCLPRKGSDIESAHRDG
jgi:4-alpha-glucanotransferase